MVVIISWNHRSLRVLADHTKSLRKLMVLRAGEQAWGPVASKNSVGAAEGKKLPRGCTCYSCATIAPPNPSLMMIVVMIITIWLTVTI